MRVRLGAGLTVVAVLLGACTAEPATTAPGTTAAETAAGETATGGSTTPPTTDPPSAGPGTTGSADACNQEPSRPGEDPTLQEVLDDAAEHHDGGVVVGLGRDGEDVRLCAAGAADTSGTPLRPDDVFRIGSITKTFTAVLLLQLVEEGELGLDDPASDHLPDIALVEGVSVRQLLNHSSGIPDYVNDVDIATRLSGDPDRIWTVPETLALVEDLAPEFSPGTEHQYSNTNYLLAGLIVEAITGSSLEDNLRDRIADPLDLADTGFPHDDLTPVTGFSDFFQPDGSTEGGSYRAIESLALGAGGMVSTAPDLVVFFRALAAGELLDPATLVEMTDFRGREGLGLGLWHVSLPAGPGLGHSGDIPGYLSFAAVTPDSADVVVMLTNDQDFVPTTLLRRTFASW